MEKPEEAPSLALASSLLSFPLELSGLKKRAQNPPWRMGWRGLYAPRAGPQPGQYCPRGCAGRPFKQPFCDFLPSREMGSSPGECVLSGTGACGWNKQPCTKTHGWRDLLLRGLTLGAVARNMGFLLSSTWIYFFSLHWVFVAAHRLFLAVWGLSLVASSRGDSRVLAPWL